MRRNRRCSEHVAASGSSRSWRAASAADRGVARPDVRSVERVVESSSSASGEKEPQSRGGELEREREAVEASADRGHRSALSACELEGASGRFRVDEQTRSPDRRQRLDRVGIGRRWKRERGERVLVLCSDPRGVLLVATMRSSGQRSTNTATSGAADTICSRLSSSRSAFLSPIRATTPSPSVRPSASLTSSASRPRQEVRGFGDVSERDESDAVEELGREQAAELDEEPRLSDSAGAGDGDNAVFAGKLDERRQVVVSTDQRRGRVGQVGRQAGEPLAFAFERLWIGHHDALGRDREELERAPDVLELESPQRDDADVAPVLDLVVRGVGQHHAAGDREGLDPGGDVHRFAGEPLGLDDHLAHVDTDTNGHVVCRELPLDRDRGAHRGE